MPKRDSEGQQQQNDVYKLSDDDTWQSAGLKFETSAESEIRGAFGANKHIVNNDNKGKDKVINWVIKNMPNGKQTIIVL